MASLSESDSDDSGDLSSWTVIDSPLKEGPEDKQSANVTVASSETKDIAPDDDIIGGIDHLVEQLENSEASGAACVSTEKLLLRIVDKIDSIHLARLRLVGPF